MHTLAVYPHSTRDPIASPFRLRTSHDLTGTSSKHSSEEHEGERDGRWAGSERDVAVGGYWGGRCDVGGGWERRWAGGGSGMDVDSVWGEVNGGFFFFFKQKTAYEM